MPTTGVPIRLLNPAATPSAFPANTPFFIRHGFTCRPEERRDCMNPGTEFRLYVDDERVQTALDLHVNLECPPGVTPSDACSGRANLANFRFGLAAGPHTFRGEWWVNGEPAIDPSTGVPPLVREATITFGVFTILDTLGIATPSTTFSVFGAGGNSAFSSQLVGPAFTLDRPTVISKIGAFINNCKAIFQGVPQCPDAQPLVVQIRPSLNGVPDPNMLLGTFVLSHDDDPLTYSFESSSPDMTLGAGTYFALFASQGEDVGVLLGSASSPFTYQPGLTNVGFLDPTTGTSFASEQFAAVQILGWPAD